MRGPRGAGIAARRGSVVDPSGHTPVPEPSIAYRTPRRPDLTRAVPHRARVALGAGPVRASRELPSRLDPPRSNPRSVRPGSVRGLSHRSKRPLTSHDSSHPSQTSARPRPSASAPSTRRGSRCVEFEYSPRAFGSNDPLAPIESPGPRDRPFLTARVPSRVPQVIVERAEKSDIPDLDKKK